MVEWNAGIFLEILRVNYWDSNLVQTLELRYALPWVCKMITLIENLRSIKGYLTTSNQGKGWQFLLDR